MMPFLRNVTRGRGIPEERLVEVSHHYQALGGASPINEQNRALRAALEARARPPRDGRCRCCGATATGRRIWPTWSVAAHDDGRVRLLGLATSAYSSYSSCRQYREDFGTGAAADRARRRGPDRQGAAVLRPRRASWRRSPTAPSRASGGRGRRSRRRPSSRSCSPPTRSRRRWRTPPVRPNSATTGRAVRTSPAPGRRRAVHGPAVRADDSAPQPAWQLAYQSRSGPPHDALAGARHQRRHRRSRRRRPARA